MILLKIVIILLLLGYGSLVIYYLFKWNEIPFFKANCNSYYTTISIIIAFRNEEKNLDHLVNSLLLQDYPPLLFEIILVDDHSDDNSFLIAEQWKSEAKKKGINLKIIKSESKGKKSAMTEGVNKAVGELIVTTDADCYQNRSWIRTIACYYQYFNFDAASAPVMFDSSGDGLNLFYQLEFLSLISIGGASVESGAPVMCNGANLVFKKTAFNSVGGFEGIDSKPSGDDVLLFQKLAKANAKLTFIKSRDAIVTTQPPVNVREFINQRKRWSSKVTDYFYPATFVVALIVYLFNLSVLASGILSFFSGEFFRIFVLIFSVKVIVDFIFFHSILKFFNKKKLILLILPAEILNTIYIVVVGTLAPLGSYKWKERSY